MLHAAGLYNMRPHLITCKHVARCGRMYKKITVLEMYTIVQIASAKIPERDGSTLPSNFYGGTSRLLVTRVSPIYLVDEFMFSRYLFLMLLNEMRIL